MGKGHRTTCKVSMLQEQNVIDQIAEEHGKSPSQIILAWHLSQGLIAIPRSGNPSHQKVLHPYIFLLYISPWYQSCTECADILVPLLLPPPASTRYSSAATCIHEMLCCFCTALHENACWKNAPSCRRIWKLQMFSCLMRTLRPCLPCHISRDTSQDRAWLGVQMQHTRAIRICGMLILLWRITDACRLQCMQ